MLGTVLGVVAIVLALVALAVLLRRPVANGDQALRNDVNVLRETTNRSIQQLSDVFGKQLQGIGDNVQTALAGVRGELNERLNQNAQAMNSASESVTRRMASVQETFATLQKQVGEMGEQARGLAEMSRSIAELQRILTAPKLRGGFGEEQLEGLLQEVFAASQFRTQYPFRSGEIADAVLLFPQGMVAVDSKFPLENFKRIAQAEGESERKAARREFLKDVRKHIDGIASKYILPAEGTLPFALMYVPAEGVYYEAVIRDEEGNDLYSYCVERHVFPVSPNSLYAYLHTILVGLNGMRISQRAEEILRELQSLQVEMGKFNEDYQTLGKHLRNATAKFDDGSRSLTVVSGRMERLARQADSETELPAEKEKKALGQGEGEGGKLFQ